MEIYWEGTNITGSVLTRKCVHRDACGNRCDSLEMEFENADGWYRWGPEEDDRVRVTHGNYDTGTLYLHSILPEDGKFRVVAAALPCAARKQEYRSFSDLTIADVLRSCGAATGMGYGLYGLDGLIETPYIQQENESAAAFLRRMLEWEGATLKCVNGKYAAIGIEYAQGRASHQNILLTGDRKGAIYRRNGMLWRSVTVKSPWGEATAWDSRAAENGPRVTLNLPARNNLQAGRWARGSLLKHNRETETLILETTFNAGFSAMTHIRIHGGTDADGDWLIEEVEHDIKNENSKATMHRCVTTIR